MSDPLATMSVEVSVLVPAAPEHVFALLRDVEQMAGLGPEHVAAHWTSTERGVGATFVGRNRNGSQEWEVPCQVVRVEPPTAFAWTVGDPARPTATWTCTLTVEGEATRVRQVFQHGPGRSFLRAAVDREPERAGEIVAARRRDLAANMRVVLEAVGRQLA